MKTCVPDALHSMLCTASQRPLRTTVLSILGTALSPWEHVRCLHAPLHGTAHTEARDKGMYCDHLHRTLRSS